VFNLLKALWGEETVGIEILVVHFDLRQVKMGNLI
jgi:hypothetical protein